MKLNLHIHTNHSDVIYNPREVVDIMVENQFDVISITDHDKLSGLPEAKEYASQVGIQLINGIEISSLNDGEIECLDSKGSLHILAYSFDYDQLISIYDKKKNQKDEIAKELLQQLLSDGYAIWECLDYKRLNTTSIGKCLVKSGYANSLDAAFKDILDLKYSDFRIKSFQYQM